MEKNAEEKKDLTFWTNFNYFLKHNQVFNTLMLISGIIVVVASIIGGCATLSIQVDSFHDIADNILRVDSPNYENTIILGINVNSVYTNDTTPIPVGVENSYSYKFDDEFEISRGLTFISACGYFVLLMYCVMRWICLTVTIVYGRNWADDRSERMDVFWFGLLWMAFCVLMSWCFFMNNETYMKGQQIYSEAIQAIPMDFDKSKYTDAKLKTKFNLVNSYLLRMAEKGVPQAYSIRNKKYIPFDENIKLSRRPLTEIDEIFDRQEKERL